MSNRVRPTRSTRRRSSREAQGLPPWLPIVVVVGVVALGVLAAVMAGRTAEDSAVDGIYVSDVFVDGDALPPAAGGGADPAVGMTAPELEGRSFDASLVSFLNDGSPRVLVFVAHWCPHCQRDVADVTSYLADHPVPDGVEIQTVSTLVDENASNYPPDRWLESEGWPWPVMNDDEDNAAARAFGLTGTPLWVFIDADGRVVQRVSGEIGAADLWDRMEALAAGTLG